MAKALFGLGFIFLVIALAGSMDYTVHKSTENIALPPMGSATGWEPLPIPDVMGLIDVDVTADWEGDVYWLGVTSKEEAQRCDPDTKTRVSLTCSGNDIDFEVGGPSAAGSAINWNVESGEWYACVGQNSGTFGQTSELSVNLHATASLAPTAFTALLGLSGAMMLLGLFLRKS
tara:strand:+ start:126 stop:647 length:522 start_codon:yes stop_codon:yes gene_type:complete